MSDDLNSRSRRALEKLAKWRVVLAGWHLGTAPKDRPGVQAMRDLREAVLMLRVEVNALTGLLAERKIFTAAQLTEAIGKEAALTDAEMNDRFPGYRSDPVGIVIYDPERAAETARRLGFPP